MRRTTYQAAEREEQTVSAFLMVVLDYGQEIGLFSLLGSKVKVKMKQVRYSLVNKAQTVMASLVMGCGHNKAINEVLEPERAAASYLWLERFPDQSQINRYLTRYSEENVEQLGEVHAEMMIRQSRARQAVGWIVVDIDQCGLVANGKTYEFKRKGYFPRKRGEEGYQMSAAYIGAYDEAVQMYLDPGNIACGQRLADLLRDIDRVFGGPDAAVNPGSGVKLVRRLDAGYDSVANRFVLMELPGCFILKSRQPELARKLAQQVPLQDWTPVEDTVHGTELPMVDGCRRLLYEFYLSDGTVEYSLLYTNLPVDLFGVRRCFAFYNERQTIEAFFAQARHVYNIQNLRSRKFNAIYAFLRFVFLTHNLIHWVKQTLFAQTELAQATTRDLVHHVARVRAHWSWAGTFNLFILPSNRWAALLLDALQPRVVQLELPFARLHKT
jgi:hypothetical protein